MTDPSPTPQVAADDRRAGGRSPRPAAPVLDTDLAFRLSSQLTQTLAWEIDPEIDAIAWSGDAIHILPIEPPTTLTGLYAVVHPDDVDHVIRTVTDWIEGGEMFDLEHRFWNEATGKTIWMRARGTKAPAADGSGLRLYGVAQDITEYRQREFDAELLSDIQVVLESTTDIFRAIDIISGKTAAHLGLSQVVAASVAQDEDRISLIHDYREPDSLARSVPPGARLSHLFSGDAIERLSRGEAIAIDDLADNGNPTYYGAIAGDGPRAHLLIPHRVEGKWINLVVAVSDEPRHWSRREIDLLATLTERVALRLEQIRVLREYRRSEDRYRTLFESIYEGFCICEVIEDDAGNPIDARFVEVNPAFARHSGLKNVVGRRISELVDRPEDFWSHLYTRVIRTGQPTSFTGPTELGGDRWFEAHAFPIGEGVNNLVAMLFIDITDRKLNEDAVRDSEARLRKAIEIDTIGIYFFRKDHSITEANDAFLRMSGYTRDDLHDGVLDAMVITPDEWMSHSLQAQEDLFGDRHMDPYEREFLRKDGSRMWGLVAGARVSHDEAVKYVIDVTGAKRMEQEQARLAAIVESAHDTILRLEPDGTIADANHAATLLYGYPMRELIGLNVVETAPSGRRREFEERYAALSQGREVPPWETVRRRNDGSEVQVEIRMSPIRNPVGAVIGCSELIRDVSERKRLAQAQEDFLAMASHDLRSPVTVLLGRAQLMRRRQAYDESGVQTIISQARRIERLTTDLQQVVHLESGQLELERSTVNLTAVARAAIDRLGSTAPGIDFHLRAPEAPVIGHWDRHRLSQVMDNLLNNAVKYSPAGGDITVEIESRDGQASLRVIDHGIGINPEDLANLFERFYRSREARQSAGLGLGLYISRVLLEAHGGSITATSIPGTETIFTVTLPQTGGDA
jgi:PAS domain S-box-containing protein